MIVKRAFDVTVAAIGLVALAPLFLLIAAAVRAESAGPAWFRQTRVGRLGRPFTILKFRTMQTTSGSSAVLLTIDPDPRLTRVGAFLRRYKLDELPQLLNVLAGEMSLVGPRPEIPEFVNHYSPELRTIILSVRPGITDTASIAFRHESAILARYPDPRQAYVDYIMPQKLEHCRRYIETRSMGMDLRILFKTLWCLLR